MKKIFVIFIAFSLFISSLCTIDGCKTLAGDGNSCTTCEDGYLKVNSGAACLEGCKTEDSTTAGKCGTCNEGYLKVNSGAACFYGCKTEDSTTAGKCATCNDGYTLSTDKASCTAEAKKDDDTKDDDKSSSFGLYTSLLIFALVLLF